MTRLRPELDFATDATADFLRELVRLRSCGLLPELQPTAKLVDLEAGYLARAFRTAVLEAIRWARDHPAEPPVERLTPLADALEPSPSSRPTAPPPPDWDADLITPLVDSYPPRRLTGELSRYLPDRAPTRTLRATVPPPPPPAGRHGPPPLIPELHSKQIRDRRKPPR